MYSGDDFYGDDITSPLERPQAARTSVIVTVGDDSMYYVEAYRDGAVLATGRSRKSLNLHQYNIVADYAAEVGA